ncbi:MAG: hypothetical protein LBR35_02420 [Rickettsiales bacterium]|jgi:hypothetical protein|nr:hypothetical protein [Rickettsiales bacterium]
MNTHFLNFFIGATFSILILAMRWWALKFQKKSRNTGKFLLFNAIFRILILCTAFVVIWVYVTWKDALIFALGYMVFTILLNRITNSFKNINNNQF